MKLPARILPMILLLASLACLSGLSPAPTQTSLPLPTVAAGTRQYTLVRVTRADGALADVLRAQVGKAKSAFRRPFVELDATWCPPCQAIRQSLDSGDPRMVDAFAGTYIVQMDVDEWGNSLGGTGFDASAIPAYYELDQFGRPTGRMITGAAWGDNIPENMAPPLKAFFRASK